MATDQLLASASTVDITPNDPCWMAGYAGNRRSCGVRHRLTARCLALRQAGVTVVLVVADVIGLPWYFGQRLRRLVHDVVAPGSLVLCATHTHSGPDTIGLWGATPEVSGVSPAWMRTILLDMERLVRDTVQTLQPARAVASCGNAPDVSVNIRDAGELDRVIAVCALQTHGGEPIASVVNFGCHPEILNNRLLTPDFPHNLRQAVESRIGGVCLFVNGALGGMVTAAYDESASPPGENWAAAAAIGGRLGRAAVQLITVAPSVGPGQLATADVRTRVPVENRRFDLLRRSGVLRGSRRAAGYVTSSVAAFRLGSAVFITMPGEPVPAIGKRLRLALNDFTPFLMSLGNDELGYILTPAQFQNPLYQYEQSMSMGTQTADRIERAVRSALRKVGVRVSCLGEPGGNWTDGC
ncbi:MAG: hypothetical protein KGJ62_05995 [Armatimonadetes bacterium]|nr:hypothetical protein [Armatimonadota bacterium]MDE2207035.1 hypothetical protein [Armatimonadota bacterium]